MSSYTPDSEFSETPVKNPGKSKGRKGNVSPKVYAVPDLINEGSYEDTKPRTSHSGGGKGAGWKSSGVQAPANAIEAIYNTAPKGKAGGAPSISTLPGQYTGVPKSGGK